MEKENFYKHITSSRNILTADAYLVAEEFCMNSRPWTQQSLREYKLEFEN